jgi:carboxypeptidase T
MLRRASVVATALAALLIASAAPALGFRSTEEFPAGYEAYHTYTEVVAVLNATVAAHPQIARMFSIGKSYEGREIWALKISDNVKVDEPEPEILSVSLVHAREHITTEMNLYLIRALTTGYGNNARMTDIVNTREIFIIPVANPDGGEWDIASGAFRKWRKNRQPNPGVTAVGTDLNRNFSFNWGCCGGSSGKPSSIKYRGPEPFSAPETRRLRDFIDSRVIGGRQQIKIIFNWHSYGELIMWPYGYTMTDVPKTMSADDHRAMVALGKEMARLNGYRAMQGSDLYIYDGDFMAWAYGVHRIVGFTFEMYPPHGAKAGGFYPSPSVLDRETKRNRQASLYLMEQADCPYRAAGLSATHCGPLNDDFETSRGWTVNPSGTDTATKGAWERAVPQKTSTAAGVKQRAATPSGRHALVTGAKAGAKANANDLDGGVTSVRSPSIKLGSGNGWRVTFRHYFAHNAKSSKVDFLRLRVVSGGTSTTVFEQLGAAKERNATWSSTTLNLDAHAGQNLRLFFEAADNGPDSLVEAALDDVRVYRTGGAAAADARSDGE